MSPSGWLLVAALCASALADPCVRSPRRQTDAPRQPGNNGFRVDVWHASGNGSTPGPDGYVPGEYYKSPARPQSPLTHVAHRLVVLHGYRTEYTVQTFRGFALDAVTADDAQPAGKFQVARSVVARVSPTCWHAVSETSLQPKTSVEVLWRAPKSNVGCVLLRAMVLAYRDVWYMDDGPLNKRFCQIIGYERLVADDEAQECCACDEAKYELVFDGLWSRQTHPKDFPTLAHLTHFSDMIGASHSARFQLWAPGAYATDGLKELAEWGNTYKMEQELKEKAPELRTIIKARGLWYPHVQGTAKALFRVDKYHHLMSLATMLGPSPDWCVGLTAVNLCLPDCSWANERTFELYPWDAGTDSGATYMAPNNPTLPRQRVKMITTKDPADPRSPFYSPYADEMAPLARITLRRERVYAADCKNDSEYRSSSEHALQTSEEDEYKDRRECMVGAWTPWSLCSATCGKGIRMRSRVYKFPIKAQMFFCDRQVTEKQFCNAELSVCEDSEAFNEDCGVRSWAEWAQCSVSCGTGTRWRSRSFVDAAKSAAGNCNVTLRDTDACDGAQCEAAAASGSSAGEAGPDCAATADPLCRTTVWSDWSPCSASCGDGMRVRTRLFFYSENGHRCSHHSLMEKEGCNVQTCERFYVSYGTEICNEEMETGQCGGTFARYYYDSQTTACRRFVYTGCKGNRNRFETEDQCKQACVEGYTSTDAEIETNSLTTTQNASPKINIMATVYRPKSGSSHKTTNRLIGDSSTSEPTTAASSTSAPNLLSHAKVMRRLAQALHVKSLEPFRDPKSGSICVPADQLASALGVDRAGGISDGGAALDCMVTEWAAWSHCSASCGRGRRQRTRSIKVLPRNGGRACPPKLVQRRRCEQRPCPLPNCVLTSWSSWSQCSATCGDGEQQRRRRRLLRRGERADAACERAATQERRVCSGSGCRYYKYFG